MELNVLLQCEHFDSEWLCDSLITRLQYVVQHASFSALFYV